MIFSRKFISATREYATYEKAVPAPYLRRELTIRGKQDAATITITGLGFYKLFVNGTEITKGLMAPYISNSDEIVYYDQYDLKPYLVNGKNVFGFILGNGFQNCIGGDIWDIDDAIFRSAPKLAFAIELTKGDKTEVIEADDKVLTHPSPILFDDERCGVHYDARLELDGWNTAGFDAKDWAPAIPVEPARGECVLCTADPIRVYREIAPVSITEGKLSAYTPRGDVKCGTFYDPHDTDESTGFLYDFGENNAGIIRLKIKGKKGQVVTLQFGETLGEDGGLFYGNIHFYPHGYVQRDLYTCRGDGEEEIFVPDFTYHGFRYCWVSGITKKQATKGLLTYLVAGSDLAERGSFSCSDEVANKLQECARRADRANFYYFPTDCPHREKNGWTGDASVSSEHMTMNLAVEKSYREWLHVMRNTQRRDGALPGIVPTGGWGYDWGNGPIWDSVAFNLPFYTYRYRGDKEIILENAGMMMKYLDYILKRRDARGLIAVGLGDWCPVGKDAADYDVALAFTDSVAVMDSARKASVMFRAVGLHTQAMFAERAYRELRGAIRRNLIDFNTMTVLGACQSGQAIGIALGVFEEAEKSEAFNRLLEFIAEKDDHFDVGFYGARYIFRVLADFGEPDLAYKMITRPDYPSYGNWIERGATTLWESFYPEGNAPASLNHHFWGDISAWFITYITGITVNPRESDPKNVDVKPHFLEDLGHAEGYYDTVCGKLSVAWKRGEKGAITLDITVPDGVYGDLIMPFGYLVNGKTYLPLASGNYTVTPKN